MAVPASGILRIRASLKVRLAVSESAKQKFQKQVNGLRAEMDFAFKRAKQGLRSHDQQQAVKPFAHDFIENAAQVNDEHLGNQPEQLLRESIENGADNDRGNQDDAGAGGAAQVLAPRVDEAGEEQKRDR